MERHSFWWTCFIVGPLLAFCTGMVMLRSRLDEAGYCQNLTQETGDFNPFIVAAD